MEGILNAKDYNERRVFTMKKILKKLALIVTLKGLVYLILEKNA